MQYLGGKFRAARHIAAVIQKQLSPFHTYVEPFLGGAASLCAIEHPHRIASDIHPALMSMWLAVQGGWIPPELVDESLYEQIKTRQDAADPLTAFVGFGCSFGGKWFGGYARAKDGKNYAAIAHRSIMKNAEHIKKTRLYSCAYFDCPLPKHSVVYCDPPYCGTTAYGGVDRFDHAPFWEWCRYISGQGHGIFVSEYTAPTDFRCVLTVPTHTRLMTKSGIEPRLERLFTFGQ